jgi:hypothetical protein
MCPSRSLNTNNKSKFQSSLLENLQSTWHPDSLTAPLSSHPVFHAPVKCVGMPTNPRIEFVEFAPPWRYSMCFTKTLQCPSLF